MNFLFFLLKKSRLCLILCIMMPMAFSTAQAERIKKVAILAFETNTQNDIAYITYGALNMFHSRLSWEDQVEVIKKSVVNNFMSDINRKQQKQKIVKIGEKTDADYVITGIITNFSDAYSIDTKVYNLKKKTFLTFYEQCRSIDKLVSRIDIVAAKINKKIFNRETLSYEKYKQDQIITEEELRRMNPEKMMPVDRMKDKQEKPWWKIW